MAEADLKKILDRFNSDCLICPKVKWMYQNGYLLGEMQRNELSNYRTLNIQIETQNSFFQKTLLRLF